MPMMNINKLHSGKSKLGALVMIGGVVAVCVALFMVQTCNTAEQVIPAPEVLYGEKVILRQPKEEYCMNYHKAFSDDVRKNLEFPLQISYAYTVHYFKHELERVRKKEMLMYLIFDKKEDKLIGSTEIRELNDLDPGQLGIWINEHYRGGGRALEALRLIIGTYFKVHPEHKSFIAHVRLWNQASYKLLTKAGLQDIGRFYEHGEPRRYIMQYSK